MPPGDEGAVMSEPTPGRTARGQRATLIAGAGVLALAVAGALYFLLQLAMPTVLAVAVGLLVVALAVGRFYLVAKHELR